MSLAIERESQPPLTRAFRTLALLIGEGASLGLGAWFFRASERLPAYLGANTLSPVARRFVVINMLGGAIELASIV